MRAAAALPLFSQLRRRPISDADTAFLLTLYASARAEEMTLVDWPDDQKAAFLHQQFTAQHTYYHAQYPYAAYDLLLLNDLPVGRLYVDRGDAEIHVLDITLLPEFRNHGLGTALLQELMQESETANLPLRLHVEAYNPAFRLYTRLGFHSVSSNGIYTLMEYLPK